MKDKILLIIILTLLIIAQTYEYMELKELEARTIQTTTSFQILNQSKPQNTPTGASIHSGSSMSRVAP